MDIDQWTSEKVSFGGSDSIITLVEGAAFCISGRSGDIVSHLPQGLFFRDTRFLSEMRLRVNGRPPEPLAATSPDSFSGSFVLRNHPTSGQSDSHLVIYRHRYIGRGMREDIRLQNFGAEPAFCAIELTMDCDFADLFEVKAGAANRVGQQEFRVEKQRLVFHYRNGANVRGAIIDFPGAVQIKDRIASFEVIVPARGEWSTCIQVTPVIDDEEITPTYPCNEPVEQSKPLEKLEAWRRALPQFSTDHPGFHSLLTRSMEDLAALRMFDRENPTRVVVAAGAPWFMTLFGRDSLITSWMSMMVDSDLALGTLQTLADFQGKEINDLKEEEPGKILHEMRFGESASSSRGGERVYYGTVDATPLFVMLLGELQRWGNNPKAVDALLPAADAALEWMEKFGDKDGDGYIEYQRKTDRGLQNQGWKESWDAIRFQDGRLAQSPIALCEVQAYQYGAFIARSHFATEHGDTQLSEHLKARAAQLKERFNEDFWDEEQGWFAMALDHEKNRVDALASNMGHCLWTGIVDEEKAPLVVEKLMSPQMFSGWGVRTLATSVNGYNPVSYQCGSVWPHDTALAVAGMIRYGFIEEAHRVMEGIVNAAGFFGNRLPELFAGLSSEELSFPVSYPTSCSPQAWAAASPLLFLRSMLRFEPDIRNAELRLAPAIPNWIGLLRLDAIPLMGGHLSIEMEGEHLEVVEMPEGLTIVRAPRRATT